MNREAHYANILKSTFSGEQETTWITLKLKFKLFWD